MATAEQNTLLGLQLFSPIAEQVASQNAAKTNLLLRLMQMQREEAARRELATMQAAREDARWAAQGEREDARWKAQGEREVARDKAAGERENTRIRDLQTRETERADAADRKQLRNAIAQTYPKYAAAAKRLGETARSIKDFEESWEGLGELQAELARLDETRVQRDQDAASTAAIGELDEASTAVKESRSALEALMRPSPDDEKYARTRAVEAVRQAIETGNITGAPKANSAAAKKGLEALSRGNVAEATQLLGSEVLSQFDAAVQAAMQAAPNFKSRMQQVTVAQQNYQTAQRNLAAIQSDLRKAAAGNNSLATKLTERRSGLQQLMTAPEVQPKKSRSLEEIFPAPPATPVQPQTNQSPPAATPGVGASRLVTSTPRFDFDTLGLVTGGAPIVDTPAPDANTRRNEAVADFMRSSGYGLLNLFRPQNWQTSDNAIYYDPMRGTLPAQMQQRLSVLRDQESPTAQALRNRLLLLQGGVQ